MRRLRWLGLSVLLCACASSSPDLDEAIQVISDPPGATAALICRGMEMGSVVTPGELEIDRTADFCSINVAKEGYVTERVSLRRRPTAAGFLGPLGAVVAASQGATTEAEMAAVLSKHSPNPVKVVLRAQ